MASGRRMWLRIWALPATSAWGIGVSIMATCGYCSKADKNSTALAALASVPLKSKSSLNCGGTAAMIASIQACRSNQVRALSLAVV